MPREDHSTCYEGFELIESRDSGKHLQLCLVGHWKHEEQDKDGNWETEQGIDELADFLCCEYNEEAIKAKAEKITEMLNNQLDFVRTATSCIHNPFGGFRN